MKKIIKYFLIVISSLVVIVITALILIWTISNDERKIAKDFTLLSSSGKYNEASELMHNALKKEFTLESFEKAFKNAKPYIETSFQSVNIENSVTTLEGTAKTADNCTSKLYFEILDEKIISFNISPLC
tara:strand:- start:413 stop:799 length:387 start_codon:yes stop_codon:yes gene_type:complete